MALYGIHELDQSFESMIPFLKTAANNFKDVFEFLDPPSNLGDITVTEVFAANTAKEHCDTVHAWSRSAWRSWVSKHDAVGELFNKTRAIL